MAKTHLRLSATAQPRSRRARLLATVFGIALPVISSTSALAAKIEGQFSGGAKSIGVSGVSQDLAVALHNSAAEACPCRGTRGQVHQKTTSSIDVPGILSVGATAATAYGDKTRKTASTSQSSTITSLNLFGGMITADSLIAMATVNATPSAFTKSDDGTAFTNLSVNGTPVNPNVPDNTIIALPGLGQVTIKEVSAGKNTQEANEAVSMLVVDITKTNSLGLPVGAKLVIGQAKAKYERMQPVVALSGGASGVLANAAAGAALDEAAGSAGSIGIPDCSGTNGQTLTTSVNNLAVGGLLSIGTITNTAFGGPQGKASVAATSSTASNVSLLNGLITASSIEAAAQESSQGGADTPSTAGSGFVGLAIGGIPVGSNLPPNTSLSLPGVGSVIINEQLLGAPSSVQVNGLHIKVTQQNLLGLAVGAEVIVAHASAAAKRF